MLYRKKKMIFLHLHSLLSSFFLKDQKKTSLKLTHTQQSRVSRRVTIIFKSGTSQGWSSHLHEISHSSSFFFFFFFRLLFFPSSCVRLSSANSSSMKIIQLVSENSACRSDVWPQLFEINFHSLGKSWKKLIGLTIKKEKCVSCAFLKNCEKKNSIKILILVNQ